MYFNDHEGHVIQLDGIRAIIKSDSGIKDRGVFGIGVYYYNEQPSYDHRTMNLWLEYNTYQKRDEVWDNLVRVLTQ